MRIVISIDCYWSCIFVFHLINLKHKLFTADLTAITECSKLNLLCMKRAHLYTTYSKQFHVDFVLFANRQININMNQ